MRLLRKEKKSKLICLLIMIVALCTACGKEDGQETDAGATSGKESAFATNEELFDFVIESWQNHSAGAIYEYTGKEIQELMSKEAFVDVFEGLSAIGGEMLSVSEPQTTSSFGTDVYTTVVEFENITLDWNVSIRMMQLNGFTYNMHFKDSFEIRHENNIVEKYFVIKKDGCELNAVYTYVDDGEKHPAVLLIAGSGPSDYNVTIGLLSPFQDIAQGLAQRGVNSLRLDKRTLNYPTGTPIGMEEEYFADCREAMAFLKEQDITNLYLLEHSLGGQIAPELAVKDGEIDGMILFNSTPRHLADLACDQYVAMDPGNKNTYISCAEEAKTVQNMESEVRYYFGADDYYWSTYNELDTIQSIKDANMKTLIINSNYDNQIFQTDIDMWKVQLEADENVKIHIYEDISHFGYKIDTKDTTAFYKKAEFPVELLDEFAGFCE